MTTADLGTGSGGLWTRAQALRAASRGWVQSQVRQGHWRSPWPGVLGDTGTDLDAGQRAWAAVLASGGAGQPLDQGGGPRLRAVASGRTAARVLGIPLIDDHDPATGGQEHLLDDVAVASHLPTLTRRWDDGQHELRRHVRRLSPGQLLRRADGLWITAPLQTLVDLAGLLTPEALVCAIDHALHVHLVDEEQLRVAVEERAGCPHVASLRQAVACADRRAESPAETLARLALQPVLPGLVPQHRLVEPGGRVLARFDLGDDALRLAVEVDGKRGHAGAVMAARDQRRDRVSARWCWRTERCTWWDLRRERPALVRRVLEAAAEQAARFGLRLPP